MATVDRNTIWFISAYERPNNTGTYLKEKDCAMCVVAGCFDDFDDDELEEAMFKELNDECEKHLRKNPNTKMFVVVDDELFDEGQQICTGFVDNGKNIEFIYDTVNVITDYSDDNGYQYIDFLDGTEISYSSSENGWGNDVYNYADTSVLDVYYQGEYFYDVDIEKTDFGFLVVLFTYVGEKRIYIPCYSEQNGYYSNEGEAVLSGGGRKSPKIICIEGEGR